MNIPVILKELAKVGAVALTEESVKSFVETKIKPIFANWGKEDSRSIELEECLSEYLLRCYAKNNIITTIVFASAPQPAHDLKHSADIHRLCQMLIHSGILCHCNILFKSVGRQ